MLKFSFASALIFVTAFSPFCALNVNPKTKLIAVANGPDQTVVTQGFPLRFITSWYFNEDDGRLKTENMHTEFSAVAMLLNSCLALVCSTIVMTLAESIPFGVRLWNAYRKHRREMQMLDDVL